MKKYVAPSIDLIEIDDIDIICTSSEVVCPKYSDSVKLPNEDVALFDNIPDNPKRLKRLLPLFSAYNDLEPDMKQEIKKYRIARVVRRIDFYNIPYCVIAEVEQVSDEDFLVTYMFLGNSGQNILLAINVEDIVEFLVRQIREKTDEGYIYHLSKEVRKKLPVFSKLMDNAEFQKESVPYLSTIDEKKEHLLLMAYFNEESIDNQEGIWVLQESLLKIAIKLTEEINKAGILNQSKLNLLKNFIKASLIANRLN